MAVDRRFLAKSATQSATWALVWRSFAAFASLAVSSLVLHVLMPELRVFNELVTSLAVFWIALRFTGPAMLYLHRHYWRVFDLSVPAEPSVASAIVLQQWSNLRHDLTLPWRAIRG